MATTRKLVLHFDVNETILVGDPAGGDTFEHSLNKVICKNAFVRPRDLSTHPAQEGERWTDYMWIDNTPLDPSFRGDVPHPPVHTGWEWPEGCRPFYRVKHLKAEFAREFTLPHSPGSIYKPLYDRLKQELCVQEGQDVHECLSHDQEHHFLIPAFFHTLKRLSDEERDFALVMRTFGTDLPHVANALNAWADGHHTIPGVPKLAISPDRIFKGNYDSQGTFTLSKESPAPEDTPFSEAESLHLMENQFQSMGVQDHYEWWADHHYDPGTGKPLWLTLGEEHLCHHIFFDDNIHNDPEDSIVSIRVRDSPADSTFHPLTGEGIRQLQGTVLVRVPILEAILNPDWFCDQIRSCEERFASERDFILDVCTKEARRVEA